MIFVGQTPSFGIIKDGEQVIEELGHKISLPFSFPMEDTPEERKRASP